MAKSFRRRGRGRRLRFKRRRSYGGRRSFKKRVKRVIKQFADKKFVVGNLGSTSFNLAAQPTTFSAAISTGTSDSTRIGNQIDVRSLQVRFLLRGNTGGTTTNQTNRLIIGCWNEYFPDPTPTASELLVFNQSAITALYNRDTLSRRGWTPMYDRVFHLNTDVDAGVLEKAINLKFYGKRLPHKRKTFSASGTPDSVYFWMFINDDVGASANSYIVDYRMTYTDV